MEVKVKVNIRVSVRVRVGGRIVTPACNAVRVIGQSHPTLRVYFLIGFPPYTTLLGWHIWDVLALLHDLY